MARLTMNGSQRRYARLGGFTLIELLVVMVIVGVLMSWVAPSYFKQSDRARETVLRQNLKTLRTSIDDYRADHNVGPSSLDVLVTQKYLRELPIDPITGQQGTWRTETDDSGGIREVHSGAPGKALDGSTYGQW